MNTIAHPMVNVEALLRQEWRQRYGREPSRVTLQRSWSHPYSLVQVWQLADQGRTERLVTKQYCDHPCNAIHGERSNAAVFECAALQQARRRLQGHAHLAVPDAWVVDPSIQLLVLEYVDGELLDEQMSSTRLGASGQSFERCRVQFRRLGEWLHQYQKGCSPKDQQRRPGSESLQPLLMHCDSRLEWIEQHPHPDVPDDFRASVMSCLGRCVQQISEEIPFGACHGDFGPWNALVGANQITVMDFFAHRSDCLLVDPLTPLVYLETLKLSPTLQRRRICELQAAFLAGWNDEGQVPWEAHIICEANQRINRIYDALPPAAQSVLKRLVARRVIRHHVAWFRQLDTKKRSTSCLLGPPEGASIK